MFDHRTGRRGALGRGIAIVTLAAASTACQSKPDEPAPRPASEGKDEPGSVEPARSKEASNPPAQSPPANASASAAPTAAPSGQEPSEAELAQLPYPPFPGAKVKRFLRQPTWARPGAYTLSAEGAAKREDVTAFYMQRLRKKDPSAEAEQVLDTYVRIRSTSASLTIDVTVSKDGKTVTVQIGYGMF